MKDRTLSKQQTSEALSRSQYMPLDEARRSHDVPVASSANTSQISGQYAPLHAATLSWEIPREHVAIEKIIGKGAFGQVAKGTAMGLRGRPQKTLVAVKMLKGDKYIHIIPYLTFLSFCKKFYRVTFKLKLFPIESVLELLVLRKPKTTDKQNRRKNIELFFFMFDRGNR